MKKKKSNLIVVIIVTILIFTIVGGIVAYLTDSDSKTNVFTLGKVKIKLMEDNWNPNNGMNVTPGEVISKDPAIENIGSNSAYVYMKVTQPVVDLDNGEIGPLFTYSTNNGWTLLETKDCGNSTVSSVYYYNTALSGNSSTSKLFNNVTIGNYNQDTTDSIKDMVITGFAIQSSNLPSGTTIQSAYNSYFLRSFENDDWATIAENVQLGNTCDYNIGDTKEIEMGDFGTHTVRVANKSTPSECSNEGFSQTACGFVVEFADSITKYYMNSNGSNVGGYASSNMRTYLNADIFNSLPSQLKDVIVDTYVVSSYGSEDNNNFTSTDKLYLLSARELDDTDSTFPSKDTSYYNTRQLDFYNNCDNIYVCNKKMFGSNYDYWWLRTATYGTDYAFAVVRGGGSIGFYADTASVNEGVAPAFRID